MCVRVLSGPLVLCCNMGGMLSGGSNLSGNAVPSPEVHPSGKRALEEALTSESPSLDKELKPMAKRRRLKSTSQYIYDALFVCGENSDVTIRSLGKEWKLHKVYLRQAGYFKSMFHSQWKESAMEVINLQIPDSNIDETALDITFGSLYSEDVMICPSKVVSILAAASLIQLEGLMQQCAEVMKEAIHQDNVCLYFKNACLYGQEEVSKTCIAWLETNLMISQSKSLLLEIEPKLLAEVISSPNLMVIQIEMDIYTILKKWLFLKENPDFSGDFKSVFNAAEVYFQKRAKQTKSVFLNSDEGEQYVPVFRALRLQHIIRDFVSCQELEKDSIIPWDWLAPLYRQQWLSMLRVEQNLDKGPDTYEKDEFECNSLRCGRLLLRDTDHCWRWNGYGFGLDLLISYSSQVPRMISLRRNVRSQSCSSSVSLASVRNILFRMHITSVNERGQTILHLGTGNILISLEKDEEKVVLTIDRDGLPDGITKQSKGWDSCFPLLISATFQLVNSPTASEMLQNGYSIQSLPVRRLASSLEESEEGREDVP